MQKTLTQTSYQNLISPEEEYNLKVSENNCSECFKHKNKQINIIPMVWFGSSQTSTASGLSC